MSSKISLILNPYQKNCLDIIYQKTFENTPIPKKISNDKFSTKKNLQRQNLHQNNFDRNLFQRDFVWLRFFLVLFGRDFSLDDFGIEIAFSIFCW